MRIFITGGAGFIGSNFVRYVLLDKAAQVLVLDKLTYAGSLESLQDLLPQRNFQFLQGDICDQKLMQDILNRFQPEAIVHLAAESHVDRSIDSPAAFIETNINGTFNLLETTRLWWSQKSQSEQKNFRFHHVSTDEVYGSLGETGFFSETTPYAPNSPYSASKAASDHLVRAYHHTYGLPVLTTNCSNNYGPYQFPEKLIPVMILNALAKRNLPIYGSGSNIRDWLYVEDHCRALWTVLTEGMPGETYNIGGHNERSNLEVVQMICQLLDKKRPRSDGKSYAEQIQFVADRPGHDLRYAIDPRKMEQILGWTPAETFESGMEKTIEWYLSNLAWSQAVAQDEVVGQRLGLLAKEQGGEAK